MTDQNDWVPIDPEVLHDRSNLVPYKVRTGDSLETIAQQVNCSWQALALLNWGTDQPDEINWYLQHFVGCKKKSGRNYIFSDNDPPGQEAAEKAAKVHTDLRRRVEIRRPPVGFTDFNDWIIADADAWQKDCA